MLQLCISVLILQFYLKETDDIELHLLKILILIDYLFKQFFRMSSQILGILVSLIRAPILRLLDILSPYIYIHIPDYTNTPKLFLDNIENESML